MSEINKKLKKFKNILDPYKKKFFAWYKKNENIKEVKKFIEPYQKKSFAWYKKSKRNKNIARVGGAIFILIIGKGILGGGPITVKATDGSKIKFKRENIVCYKEQNINGLATICTANGISKDLTGYKSSFSQRNQICDLKNNVDKEYEDLYKLGLFNIMQSGSPNSIACFAAKKKGLL